MNAASYKKNCLFPIRGSVERLLHGILALSLISLLLLPNANAAAANLPDALDEWLGTPARVTEFTTSYDGRNLGDWHNRVYTRAAPIASIEANLMKGPGAGALFVPEDNFSDPNPDPGIGTYLDFSSAYESLNIAGKRAILERGKVTGLALAVSLDRERTMTLETRSLSREELLGFAQKLIAALEEK